MQALSDLLSTRMLHPDDSYITGYPVRSMNRFAFARTWPALEIERPGAVWTHSLLLDYATLGTIVDPASLTPLFMQPSTTVKDRFSEKIEFSDFEQSETQPRIRNDERSVSTLIKLYGENSRHRIEIPSLSAVEDEILILSLWRQMWPAMRRNIAFCTRTDGELSSVEADSVLTFYSEHKGHAPTIEEQDENILPIQLLATDLESRSSTPLRNYVGRYAVDIQNARKYVPRLVSCFATKSNPMKVVKLLSGMSPSDGGFQRLKRDTLLGTGNAGSSLDDLVESVRTFRHEPLLITPDDISKFSLFQRSDFDQAIPAIIEAVSDTSSGEFGDVVLQSIGSTAPVKLLAQSTNNEEVSKKLFAIRPEIVQEPAFWQIKDRGKLLSYFLQQGLSFDHAMMGLGKTLDVADVGHLISAHGDIARYGLAKFILDQQHNEKHLPLITHLINDKVIYTDLASSRAVHSPLLLELVAIKTLKNESIKLFQLPALEKIKPTVRSELVRQPHFLTLALIIALQKRTRYSVHMLNFVFDPLLNMMDRYTLPSLCKEMLRQNIGQKQRWMISDRLMLAVVDFYSNANDIDPVILDITTNQKLKKAIIDAIFDNVGSKGLRKFIALLSKLGGPDSEQNIALCEARLERSWSLFS